MVKKNYTVGFYVATVGPDGKDGYVSTKLAEFYADSELIPVIDDGTNDLQIRDLVSLNNDSVFKGVFAKIRKSDIPHIGSTDGDEREIELEDDEGVIEKNHFIFYKKHELLVYQFNQTANSIESFGRYFSHVFNQTSIFSPVIKEDSLQRIMNDTLQPKSIELSVAKPKNPDLYPKDVWSKELFTLMEKTGAYHINFKMSGEKMGTERKPLSKKIKQSMVG